MKWKSSKHLRLRSCPQIATPKMVCHLEHKEMEINTKFYSQEYLISSDMYDSIEDRIRILDEEHRILKEREERARRVYMEWKGKNKDEVLKKLKSIPDFIREELQENMFDPWWEDLDERLTEYLNLCEVSKKNFIHHREYLRLKEVLNLFPVKDRKKYYQIFNECLPHYYCCHLQIQKYVNNVEWAREQRNISRVSECAYRLASNMLASTSDYEGCEECSIHLMKEVEDMVSRYNRSANLSAVRKISHKEYHDTSLIFETDNTLRRDLLELY